MSPAATASGRGPATAVTPTSARRRPPRSSLYTWLSPPRTSVISPAPRAAPTGSTPTPGHEYDQGSGEGHQETPHPPTPRARTPHTAAATYRPSAGWHPTS